MNLFYGGYILKPHFFKPETKFKINNSKIEYTDLLTYVALRSFHNAKNGDCFPSLQTIATRAGASKQFVKDSVERLETAKAISVFRSPKIKVSNEYSFTNFNHFDRIPYELLYADLNLYQKAMLLALRELTDILAPKYIDGTITQLAQTLEMSYKTLYTQLNSLISKGYVQQHSKNKFSLQKIAWMISDYKEPKAEDTKNMFLVIG